MSSWFQRGASLALLGVAFCLGGGAQAQTAASSNTAPRPEGIASSPSAQPASATPAGESRTRSAAASAPADKKKRASRAKTPPGKPPRGAAHCNEGDQAQRQRCLRDLYGPGAPPV